MLALIFIAGIAQADEAKFVLKTGRLSAEGNYARQVVSVENRTNALAKTVHVECGFFKGDELIGSQPAAIYNLQAGTTGYETVVAYKATEATSAKCRVVSWE